MIETLEIKKKAFNRFAEIIKSETAMGENLERAELKFEIKQRADNPSLTFTNEWLEIRANGYFYTINATGNSQWANEKQLIATLCFEDKIQGLLGKE